MDALKEYTVTLYKTVEYRVEIKVEAEDSNAAMEKGKRVYDNGYNMIVDWVVNTEKLTEIGVIQEEVSDD